jgi:hypothetical protein
MPNLARPFEELHVHYGRIAFADQAQQIVVEALDTGLNPAHTGSRQQLDLLAFQIGLCLIEYRIIIVGCCELWQHSLEKRHVENVVDKLNAADSVTSGQLGDLRQHPLGGFRAVFHPDSIEAAEGAVRFFTPPAAAGTLGQQSGLDQVGQG